MATAYTALGVSENATGGEIASAWKEKRRHFGSMRTGLRGANLSPADEASERQVNHAYEKLGKPTARESYPNQRKAYDQWLASLRQEIAHDAAAKAEIAAKVAADAEAAMAASGVKPKPNAKTAEYNTDAAKKRRDEIYANTRKPRDPGRKPSSTWARHSAIEPKRSVRISSNTLFVIVLVGTIGGIKLLNSVPTPSPPPTVKTVTAEPIRKPTLRTPGKKFHKHRHKHRDGASEVVVANRREAARIAQIGHQGTTSNAESTASERERTAPY